MPPGPLCLPTALAPPTNCLVPSNINPTVRPSLRTLLLTVVSIIPFYELPGCNIRRTGVRHPIWRTKILPARFPPLVLVVGWGGAVWRIWPLPDPDKQILPTAIVTVLLIMCPSIYMLSTYNETLSASLLFTISGRLRGRVRSVTGHKISCTRVRIPALLCMKAVSSFASSVAEYLLAKPNRWYAGSMAPCYGLLVNYATKSQETSGSSPPFTTG